jgi:GWxTD domain-containing protein
MKQSWFASIARWCWATAFVATWAPASLIAQDSWLVEALVQRLPSGDAYLEVQTSWMTEPTSPNDSMTVTVVASRGDEVLGFAKHNVQIRPEAADSGALSHVHVDRIGVPSGTVLVEWRVDSERGLEFASSQSLRVPVGGMPEVSDPLLVKTHAPASAWSDPNLVHSGLDLIPVVGRSVPIDVSSAMYYVELHRLDDVIGLDSLFLFVAGWADANGGWVPNATTYKRLRAAAVVPVLDRLPCTPTVPDPAHPVLKLEVRTRDGHVVVGREVLFGRRGIPGQGGVLPSWSDSPALPSLRAMTDSAALIQHALDHLAVASTNEQTTIQHSLVPAGSVRQIQNYLTAFWLERGGSLAAAESLHVEYLGRIATVNQRYGACIQGVGSMTEMGDIFLRFGAPNTVVQRHHETDYYPYEIWHYHKAGRFNNKRFLFYAPHVVGECFELLHSDMLGERQNEDWLSQLRSRENRLRVSESMENRLNPRDAFSREEPEDLFYNPR